MIKWQRYSYKTRIVKFECETSVGFATQESSRNRDREGEFPKLKFRGLVFHVSFVTVCTDAEQTAASS